MCELCGDPGHNDMRCPCFGYSGEEYYPPTETDHDSAPRRFLTEEFSPPQKGSQPAPDDPPRRPNHQ